LPLTDDAYGLLHGRFQLQGEPREGWIFLAKTKAGHINESSIKHQHRAAIESAGLDYFELYCLRQTFLTILGSSGCDSYTFCRIAGHGDIQMGMRYCHPQREFTEMAFNQMVQFRHEGVTKGGYHNDPEDSKPLSSPATYSVISLSSKGR
jgi:site-specific recombinase XerD